MKRLTRCRLNSDLLQVKHTWERVTEGTRAIESVIFQMPGYHSHCFVVIDKTFQYLKKKTASTTHHFVTSKFYHSLTVHKLWCPCYLFYVIFGIAMCMLDAFFLFCFLKTINKPNYNLLATAYRHRVAVTQNRPLQKQNAFTFNLCKMVNSSVSAINLSILNCVKKNP